MIDDSWRQPDQRQPLHWRPRLVSAVVAAVLTPIIVDGPISALIHVPRFDPGVIGAVIIVGVEIAKFCLLAMWLAWGGSRAVVGVIVVFVSLFITCLVFGVVREAHATEVWSALLLLAICISSVVALPKLFGVRWLIAEQMPPDGSLDQVSAPPRWQQFSLVDLFVWTATVAVVAGMIRWLGVPKDLFHGGPIEILMLLACFVGLPAAGTLLCMWTALPRDPAVIPRLILSLMIMGLLLSPLFLMTIGNPGTIEVFFLFLGTPVLSMSMVICFLLILRNLGDRVVRFRRQKR